MVKLKFRNVGDITITSRQVVEDVVEDFKAEHGSVFWEQEDDETVKELLNTLLCAGVYQNTGASFRFLRYTLEQVFNSFHYFNAVPIDILRTTLEIKIKYAGTSDTAVELDDEFKYYPLSKPILECLNLKYQLKNLVDLNYDQLSESKETYIPYVSGITTQILDLYPAVKDCEDKYMDMSARVELHSSIVDDCLAYLMAIEQGQSSDYWNGNFMTDTMFDFASKHPAEFKQTEYLLPRELQPVVSYKPTKSKNKGKKVKPIKLKLKNGNKQSEPQVQELSEYQNNYKQYLETCIKGLHSVSTELDDAEREHDDNKFNEKADEVVALIKDFVHHVNEYANSGNTVESLDKRTTAFLSILETFKTKYQDRIPGLA